MIADTHPVDTDVPVCPKCGSNMVMRPAKKGNMAGSNYWELARAGKELKKINPLD